MKASLRARAEELGFDGCRIAAATPPDHAEHFQRWLSAGRHGEMAYLERTQAKRIDPNLVLPGARSVVVLAASYHIARKETSVAVPGGCGRVARYACHTDYHTVLEGRLCALADYLNQLGGTGTQSRWYVDSGPVLERDLAGRAGLGFIGKHTNLIARPLGNWFVLAEILTTAPLEPDAPERNRCGTCARCLAACPTQAITAPFELDARRCISYLTIELKGSIPEEFRPAIGNRIFGCDECLEVCPWNRFAREGRLLQDHRRTDLDQPDLLELLELDVESFKRRFAGTPLMRSKRRGLLRNVCVALGNTGDARSLGPLSRAATDSEPLIAEHAQWAVRQVERRISGKPGT